MRVDQLNRKKPSASPLLVVGLGNPGAVYANTRHNVGFMTVDLMVNEMGWGWSEHLAAGLVAKGRLGGKELLLLKPLTFMNRSGLAVREVVREYSLSYEHIIVVYDDMDIPLGSLRIRLHGGAGGHRGLQSVIEELGSEGFKRIRIGIGRPPAGKKPADYVLEPFSPEEFKVLEQVLCHAVEAIKTIVTEGADAAMNRFNRVFSG